MKGLKKLIAIFMVMTMTVGLLAGCSEGKGNAGGNNATGGSQTGSNSDGTQTEAKKLKWE